MLQGAEPFPAIRTWPFFPFYKEYAEAALLFHRMMFKDCNKKKVGRLSNRMTEGERFPYVDI